MIDGLWGAKINRHSFEAINFSISSAALFYSRVYDESHPSSSQSRRTPGRPPFTRDLNSPEQLIRAFHSHHHGSVGNKFVDIYNLRTIKDVHKISLFMHGALPAAPRFLHVERGGCETRTMVCLLLRCHRHRGRRRRFILFIIAHTECKQSRHFLRTQSNVAHCWMIGWSADAELWCSPNWAAVGGTGCSRLQLHFFLDGAT